MQHLIRTLSLALALFLPTAEAAGGNRHGTLVDWVDFSPEVFSQAKAQDKLVLLNMAAIWCHWCHVMDKKTYSNARVANYLRANYITARADQDANPDLSNRYAAWGWPATIILDANGTELVKRAGYIAPDDMQRLLAAVVADPTPERGAQLAAEVEFKPRSALDAKTRATLEARRLATHDYAIGGLKTPQKFLERNSVEYQLTLAASGDAKAAGMVRQTLDSVLALLDPVWGGAYQYSTHGDWQHPHFEKIMKVQAGYLRIYALAAAQFAEPRYLAAAESLAEYLDNFLTSPEGAFYASQDADVIPGEHAGDYFQLGDAERRKLGIPRIDKNRYARENGEAIEALATLYGVTGNPTYLQRATRAANWVLENRAYGNGGFRHGAEDRRGGPYLADTLTMGRGMLQLYRVTGERQWLQQASLAGTFIGQQFTAPDAGFFTASSENAGVLAPIRDLEENIWVARYLNLLAHYEGSASHENMARHAMSYLAAPEIALARIEEAGVQLADWELGRDPLHLAVVGPKGDSDASALYLRGLRLTPRWYSRQEWWDRSEGPLPNHDVEYPQLSKAAGYVCTNQRCSLPAFTPDSYAERIASQLR